MAMRLFYGSGRDGILISLKSYNNNEIEASNIIARDHACAVYGLVA